MTIQNGYYELMKMMADFASAYLEPAVTARKKGESYERPTDRNFAEVFHGFTEIGGALESLILVEQLVRLAPPRSKRVDKDIYFKFLVSSYLQEMYILEQRLSAYAAKLSRLYGNPTLRSKVRSVVFLPLEKLINTRGAHVHERRFSDKRADGVSTAALFRRVGHELGNDLEFEYKLAQIEWSKRVRENNRATRVIVDQYCALLKVVICKDGKITLP